MKSRILICLACLCAVVLISACDKSNNLLLGRVEATVGGHTIVVTDCYRTSVPQPQEIKGTLGTKAEYHWTPCRDADIVIRDEKLTVNGESYGDLKPSDTVTVDHGKVLVNEREAHKVATN